MKKKYIIDLNPDCVEGEYLRIPARIAGEEQWLVTKAALTPYTEPDLEQVRKEGYDEGYDDAKGGYENGFENGMIVAWEAARKISLAKIDGGFSWESMNNMFGTDSPSKIYKTFTASESIEKIRQYEQEKEEKQHTWICSEAGEPSTDITMICSKCGYTITIKPGDTQALNFCPKCGDNKRGERDE